MFKKVILTSIISTILFLNVTFLTTNANAVDHIIKAVYFVPQNRAFQKHIPPTLADQIKRVQEVYAEQMETHGYGNKTFDMETDANGYLIVHVSFRIWHSNWGSTPLFTPLYQINLIPLGRRAL